MNATPHILESALLLLVTFFIGCLVGYGLRRVFAKPDAAVSGQLDNDAPSAAAVVPEPTPMITPEPAPAPETPASDNLKRIKGIGPAMEGRLKAEGVYHFSQIAAWNKKAIAEMDEKLNARGRIDREKWVSQAKALVKTER